MRGLALVIAIASWLPWQAIVLAQGIEAARLYAVIVNGGRNKLTNHERYWNDCAFLYRTLRHTYHIPQRNITVLMSDGGVKDDDMIRADGWGFRSSPTDLQEVDNGRSSVLVLRRSWWFNGSPVGFVHLAME